MAATRSLPPGPLRVSSDRRSLTDATGAPFFFLADTAWFIVWLGTEEQWVPYLDLRAEQGFSVIQIHLLPFHWTEPDPEGNLPFVDDDVTRPNEAYFRRFDRFCELAAERGLCVAFFLIWGGGRFQVHSNHFTDEQAAGFIRFAVERFGKAPVLWSISGDAPYVEELERWERIGASLEAVDGNHHPTTNHLIPWMNWHFLHHASPWHDFHMIQTGHSPDSYPDISALPAAYYALEPAKPIVNGEPWYEGHPAYQSQGWGRECTPYDVRYAFWVSILSGATMGHTYGAQGVWNWKREGDTDRSVGGPGTGPAWNVGMRQAGADHCAVGARVLRGLPWWQLRPSPERVHMEPPAADPSLRPFCAAAPDTWVVYVPEASGRVAVKGLPLEGWQARWVDPRTGETQDIGSVEPDRNRVWRAPQAPSAEDWALVLSR